MAVTEFTSVSTEHCEYFTLSYLSQGVNKSSNVGSKWVHVISSPPYLTHMYLVLNFDVTIKLDPQELTSHRSEIVLIKILMTGNVPTGKRYKQKGSEKGINVKLYVKFCFG